MKRYLAPAAISLAAIAIVIAPIACGGSVPQDVFDSNPTGSSGTTSGNTSGGNTSGGNTSGGNTSGGNTSGGLVDPACPQEDEPNDKPESANILDSTRCGTIQPNSESDFLAFELKPTSTSLQISFAGKVTLRIEVDGTSVTLGAGDGPKVPIVKGKRYTIEIKATARDNKIPWRVDLIEK